MLMIHFLINNGTTEIAAVENSQTRLNKIIHWCRLNRLTLNENKTKHLIITSRNHLVSQQIEADGTYRGNVDTYDYLGFSIDKKLTMTSHVDKLIKKGGFKLYSLTLM